MVKLLNKRFPTDKFPPVIVHIIYFVVSLTFCYLYYHKFLVKADFYSAESTGGIYAVLNNTAYQVIQIRVLIPLVFIGLKTILSVLHHFSDGALFFMITIIQCYFILLSFYFLLNVYFQNQSANLWIALVILYPMVWHYVIINGQFFFVDFGVLLAMTLGYYFIVSEQYKWLLVVFFFGMLNHGSVGFLIPAYLLFNYKKILDKKIIIRTIGLGVLYFITFKILYFIFPRNDGFFVKYALMRNLELFHVLPVFHIIRDLLLVFGGLHFLVALLILTGLWKKFKGPFLYISLIFIPYVISVYIYFSIEETRNYTAMIPFILIMALMFLSTLENSFLKVTDKIQQNPVTGPN